MLSYPVRLVPTQDRRVRVVFPDLPQAFAEGRDEEEALYQARFVLEMCLMHMAGHGEKPPLPSDICGAPLVGTNKFAVAPATVGADLP